MNKKKSVTNSKVTKMNSKEKKDIITKKEFFEDGKKFKDGTKQISIKELYNEKIEKEKQSFREPAAYLDILRLCKDFDVKLENKDIYNIMDIMIDVLDTVKNIINKFTIDDLKLKYEVLPTGTLKPIFNLFMDEIKKTPIKLELEKGDCGITLVAILIQKGIVDNYNKLLIEDACKLDRLDE